MVQWIRLWAPSPWSGILDPIHCQLLSPHTTTREPTHAAAREAQALQQRPSTAHRDRQTSGSFDREKLAGVTIHSLSRLWGGQPCFSALPDASLMQVNLPETASSVSSWLGNFYWVSTDNKMITCQFFFQYLASASTWILLTCYLPILPSPGYDCVFIFINFIL